MKFPKIEDERLAEFSGILLGDGSISRKQNRIQITLNRCDLDYAKYIVEMIYDMFKVKPHLKFRKKENALDIHIFRKKIVDFLTKEVGLEFSPKWNRAVVPEMFYLNDLDKFILRGYFDTDGSVVVTNNNGTVYPRLEMKVSPSPMKDSIINIMRRRNFRFGVYELDRGRVRIQMNGKSQLSKWIKEIGIRNPRYVERANNFYSGGQI